MRGGRRHGSIVARQAIAAIDVRRGASDRPGASRVTALELLFYICAALLAQLAVGIAIAAWRWRRRGASPVKAPGGAQASDRATAWPGLRAFRVVGRQFEDEQQLQCSFHLAPVDGVPLPPFRPGQFLTLVLDVPQPRSGDARAVTRCYSLSDAPQTEAYRITVKRVPPPPGRADVLSGVASNHLHDRVGEGDTLWVKAPSGRFCIDADTLVPAVFIAGGIGITPLMSMLTWSLEQQPGRVLRLYYGLRDGGAYAFRERLEALAATHPCLHLTVVYSQPRPGDVAGGNDRPARHIDVALLRQTLPMGRHQFYICGPQPMMASLVPALLAWGVAPEDIHHEAFGPASLAPVADASGRAATTVEAPVEVQFRRSGRTLVWDGRDASLLDMADRNGIAVDSGCRSGNCGTCETAVVAGTVRYAVTPDHEPAPGHCLLCVGSPGSALVLDA